MNQIDQLAAAELDRFIRKLQPLCGWSKQCWLSPRERKARQDQLSAADLQADIYHQPVAFHRGRFIAPQEVNNE